MQRAPKKLNWTKILYDQQIFIDSQAYRKRSGNLQFEGRELLQKDLCRTRSSQPYFQKPSTQQTLRRLITFYCKENDICYQQGLIEVLIPFALLHTKQFELKKCYAFFNAFMRKHFPKVLTQKTINDKKQLPHALLAISLSQTLLRYHYPKIYFLFKEHQIPLSMVLTQQILTVFAKNTQIEYVYKIYDYYINKKNKNVILYMCVALLGQHQKQLFEAAEKDELAIYANRYMKNINTQEKLNQWLQLADHIESTTPKTFELFSKDLGFTNHSMITKEDLTVMMKIQEILNLQDFIMPIYKKEVLQNQDQYVVASIEGLQLGKSKVLEQVRRDKIIAIIQSQKGFTQEERKDVIEFTRKVSNTYKITYMQQKIEQNNSCIII